MMESLDKLQTERKNLRRLFTIACDQYDAVSNDEPDSAGKKSVLYNKITDKAQRLFQVDGELGTLIELSDTDFDTVESYRDRFTEIKTKYENSLKSEFENDSYSTASGSNLSFDRLLKLPKLNLKEYDLLPRTWVSFWGQFARIHEDKILREEDKFQYLLSSLKPRTKGRDIVESYPPSKENYAKVIDHLKTRFGRDDLLIEVYIRDLLALVSNKANVKLSVLFDKLGSNLRALETLGVTTQNYAAMLYPVVESCLPSDVLIAWDRHRLNREPDADSSRFLVKEKLLEELMAFLRNEVEGEEHRVFAESGFEKQKKEIHKIDLPSATALVSSASPQSPDKLACIFCNRNHFSHDCGKVANMTREERKSAVMRKGNCLVCLKSGHFARACRSTVHCFICGKRHYAILCPELPKKNRHIPQRDNTKEDENTNTLHSEERAPTSRIIYLKTLMVRLRNKEQTRCVRVLLDDGSHRSYIEEALIREMMITPSGKEILSQGLFGGDQTPTAIHGKYDITIESLDSSFSCKISVLDQPKICSTLPRVRDEHLLSALADKGIMLTDIGDKVPPIRILLGADVLGKILTGRIEILKSGISAIETRLGWSILGAEKRKYAVNFVSLSLQNLEIPKLWDLETLGIKDPVQRKTAKLLEEETLTHFRETVTFNDNKQYEVALPWLVGHPPLTDNYDIANIRLHSVTKRLLREGIFEAYDNVFCQWEGEGIIEVVQQREFPLTGHYLPHRPVIKTSSSTTKIRPVFDASVKRPGCASLNDCLSIGPSLTQQIFPLLTRFRSGAFGVVADIQQAFLQLSVRPEDRDVLRFLWWKDRERKRLKIYRHCRVVFGVSSSPFLLNATLAHHLNSRQFQRAEFRKTVDKLTDGFYVDNLTTSVENEEELRILRDQAQYIMQEGHFHLRCWAYNGSGEQEEQMVLGLKWNLKSDELYCVKPNSISNNEESLTKRKLLSAVNSIYDPIGFLCPALLLPKLLLQEAWKGKVAWDDDLAEDITKRYKRWIQHIAFVEKCTIPRRMLYGTPEKASLHIFTDASASAYACCAFLRSEDKGRVSVQLVAAKTRVAPMQKTTIPRLELLAATIGARLATSILEGLKLSLRTFLWTDSMVVLSWITNKEPWTTFVGNRVKEIREITNVQNWRHVPGKLNPADLPSRSCDWLELFHSRWWEGPAWLRKPEDTWPDANVTIPEEALLERKKCVTTSTSIEFLKEDFSRRLLYFSSYLKIVRMIAWILRFRNNAKKITTRISSELTGPEIQSAENILLRLVQSEWPSEIKEKYSKSIQFYEDEGLLRVKTRLILSDDPEDFLCPIVLPDHIIVRRLIEHNHKMLRHSGVQTTLSCLRQRFWIPRGRRVVREVLRSCIPCKRYTSKQVIPQTSPLPTDRINRVAAFQVTGSDLAGVLYLKGGEKAWIVLFTCGVYRAIHLELVTSLSTDAFLRAMRRFIARRGRPSVLYTDNGTNFCGAARALQALDWEKIEAESALLQIKWHFSPPAAPWYGGWWERLVRSVKELLRKNLGRACLNYEEMVTLLCDIESTINSRPLTYMSDDPNELKPLTPSHFIQDIREGDTADLDIVDSKYLLKRVRYLQSLREKLRIRFKEEYLGELIRSPQLRENRSKLVPGDVVLIGSDNLKRISWPIARILELFPGKDKIQRVAKLRVANGDVIRPLQRLYPLELHQDELNKDFMKKPDVGIPLSKCSPSKQKSIKSTSKRLTSQKPPKCIGSTRCGRQVRPPDKLNL